MLSARTDNNRIVTFNGDESLIGKMISLKITDVYPHTLGGEIHE
ncbi:TRAM domain-containing protein [Turicimonas muris]|nr:TRAM domain-containing protein [Turicimonas muris]